MCNVQRPRSLDPSSPPVIQSDIIYLLILLLFGITNGWISTLCMMGAPSLKHNPKLKREQVAVSATVAQFCLVGGLVIGSVCSFGVRAMICDCDPFVS